MQYPSLALPQLLCSYEISINHSPQLFFIPIYCSTLYYQRVPLPHLPLILLCNKGQNYTGLFLLLVNHHHLYLLLAIFPLSSYHHRNSTSSFHGWMGFTENW